MITLCFVLASNLLFTKFDRAVFVGHLKELKKIADEGLMAFLTGNQVDFVRNTQVYLAQQMTTALDKFGSGASAVMVRGYMWAAWSMHSVDRPSYGSSAQVGTRSYERKFARGGTTKKDGATWDRAHRKYQMSVPVRLRAYETVWRKRASGARYSATSKLMQDTGRLKAMLILMKTTVNGNTIELRPGVNLPYFNRQNALRPIWVIDQKEDVPKIRGFLKASFKKVADSIGKAA